MTLKPTSDIGLADIRACGIWRHEEDDRLHHPVLSAADRSDSSDYELFRALFTTQSGKPLEGYVVDVTSKPYAVGIFAGDSVFVLNANLQSSAEEAARLVRANPQLGIPGADDLFLLRFQTDIDQEIEPNFSGSFVFLPEGARYT